MTHNGLFEPPFLTGAAITCLPCGRSLRQSTPRDDSRGVIWGALIFLYALLAKEQFPVTIYANFTKALTKR
jgi:hypothetical protein